MLNDELNVAAGKRFRGAVVLAALLIAPAGWTQRLSEPVHRAVVARDAERNLVARWNGLLFFRKFLLESADASPNLTVHRRDGSLLAKVRVWMPDAYRVWLEDAAAFGQGELIAAVGVAQSVRGEYEGFLALLTPAGVIRGVIRTAPFEGRAISFSADGRIWVLGAQLGWDRTHRNAPDHYVLHQYDAEGKLLKQLLRRSDFDCPGWHPASRQDAAARVLSSPTRIGVLTSPACPEWIELTLEGNVAGRWKLQGMPYAAGSSIKLDGERKRFLTGVAMTQDNEVYASFGGRHPHTLFRLRRDQGAWEPVGTPSWADPAPRFIHLVGGDGDSLIYASSPEQYVWARVLR